MSVCPTATVLSAASQYEFFPIPDISGAFFSDPVFEFICLIVWPVGGGGENSFGMKIDVI